MLRNATRIAVLALVVGFALVTVAADGLAAEKDSRLSRGPIFQECAIPTASSWAPTDFPATGLRGADTTVGARRSCGPSNCPCCYTYKDWWDNCGWGASITLAMWFPGMDGVIGTPNNDYFVDYTSWDVLSNLDKVFEKLEFMLQGRIEITKGKWTFGAIFSGQEFGDTFPLVEDD